MAGYMFYYYLEPLHKGYWMFWAGAQETERAKCVGLIKQVKRHNKRRLYKWGIVKNWSRINAGDVVTSNTLLSQEENRQKITMKKE